MKTAFVFCAGWLVVATVSGPCGLAAPARAGPGDLDQTNHYFIHHWRQVRHQQPRGLTLELKLPKTTFYQGETIEATLVFANRSTNRYVVDPRGYDRAGRLDDIAFFAEGSDDQAVSDPLRWYFSLVGSMGGMSGLPEGLGKWRLTIEANQWLRFDRPGRYRLYACANRTFRGSGDVEDLNETPPIQLVSRMRTIEIRPLERKVEAEVLARAKTDLSQGEDKAAAVADRLRYLQTPAAREVLRSLVVRAQGNLFAAAADGLLGAPEPSLEALPLLQAAEEAGCAVSREYASLYGVLKSGG